MKFFQVQGYEQSEPLVDGRLTAFAIISIFKAEIGSLHQKISDIIKQKWYQSGPKEGSEADS